MYRFRHLTLLAIIGMMALAPGHSVGAKAVIEIAPLVEMYETCVADSEPSDAHLCRTALLTGEEFAWPHGGPDPRVVPVYVEGGVFVCTSVPNMLILATVRPSTGDSLHLELNSPSACAGQSTGARGIPLEVDIYPQYDPQRGPTMIAFDYGKDFRIGACSHTPGNLDVFWRLEGTDITLVITFFAPDECARTD